MKTLQKKQTGFTLIEIAIVLVIIGLLLGGVLKGQELINNAKVKNLATDFRNIPVYIYGYQDKFKAIPGDDVAAMTHVGASNNGNGNGIIDGPWDSLTPTDESILFWQDVRLAGLAAGPTVIDVSANSSFLPRNAMGSRVGITAGGAFSPILNLRGSYIICSDGIPGKFARQLDTTLDDGNTITGSVMVMAQSPTTPGAVGRPAVTLTTANDDTPFTVCMGV